MTALISELFLHYINNNLNFLQNVQIPFDTFLKFIETILAKNEFKITFSDLRRCLIIAHYIAHLPNINLKNNCSKSEKLLDDVNEIANFFHVPIESISDFQTISNIDLSNSKTNYINQSVKWLDEFCYYPFIKLPQNFLEFSVDPYNYQILSNDDNIQYLCLLSGKCMNEESLSSYLELVHCSLFLVLSGNMAGCLKLIVKCRTIIERIVDSPYITMFGDEKYGFEEAYQFTKDKEQIMIAVVYFAIKKHRTRMFYKCSFLCKKWLTCVLFCILSVIRKMIKRGIYEKSLFVCTVFSFWVRWTV